MGPGKKTLMLEPDHGPRGGSNGGMGGRAEWHRLCAARGTPSIIEQPKGVDGFVRESCGEQGVGSTLVKLVEDPRSSNGRTAAFGAVNRGSNPCRGANFPNANFPPPDFVDSLPV